MDFYVALAVGIKTHRPRVARTDGMQIASRVGHSFKHDRGLDVGRNGETLLGSNLHVLGRGGQAAQEDGGQSEQAARVLLWGGG